MATTTSSSSPLPRFIGQGALLDKTELSVNDDEFEIPSKLLVPNRKAMRESGGLPVAKVGKSLKLQPRRLGLNKRHLYITTNRLNGSVKNLWKYVVSVGEQQQVTAKTIEVSSIVRIERGDSSSASPRFLSMQDGTNETTKVDSSRCLSIYYRVPNPLEVHLVGGGGESALPNFGPHRIEILDLVVVHDYELLWNTLERLLQSHHYSQRQTDASMLVLEHGLLELKKNRGPTTSKDEHDDDTSTTVSLHDFLQLCQFQLHVPLKKARLSALYKDFCQFENDGDSTVGLSKQQTIRLLQEVYEESLSYMNLKKDPIDQLWESIVSTDPVPPTQQQMDDSQEHLEIQIASDASEESISPVAFLSFIRSQQCEYKCTLEDVQDMILRFNSMNDEENHHPTRLTKSSFRSYLLSTANDITSPTKTFVGCQDMSHPLSHYWINTSHDTYLSPLPTNAFAGSASIRELAADKHFSASAQSYATALYRGVRAIELDTYDGPSGPVVARRGTSNTSSEEGGLVPFSHVLWAVRAFLSAYPESFPIILLIENHCSVACQEIMTQNLEEILESKGLLYVPPNLGKETDVPLPSPAFCQGKVLIKSKRPVVIKEGATVMNDDFDDDNGVNPEDGLAADIGDDDEEEGHKDDEEKVAGIVTGFNAAGPIRSIKPEGETPSPVMLLRFAIDEAEEARLEASKAKARAAKLTTEASAAETLAAKLTDQAGLTAHQVRMMAREKNGEAVEEETGMELKTFERALSSSPGSAASSPKEGAPSANDGEGVEVPDFLENALSTARSSYSVADQEAIDAAQKEKIAQEEFDKAHKALHEAEAELEASYQREKDLSEASRKAAVEARANREHADTARKRVDTVRDMLRQCRTNAASAETVVVTAASEAKISEQRASETEARASRALANAEKERAKADAETQKEELLEQEASELHARCLEVTQEARTARSRMEKAAGMLDRVNEQIKLIEGSTGYQREQLEGTKAVKSPDRPRHVTNFTAKHASKLEEREDCTAVLKAATAEHGAAESHRRDLQARLEEKARAWKKQAEVASRARKLADRASHLADDLAEQAEEEREAAALRQIAREKATKNVDQSEAYRVSVQAQLAEAERASTEAARLALDSRQTADDLAKEYSKSKDHSVSFENLEKWKKEEETARSNYEIAKSIRAVAETKALDAKRLLATSSEVYTSAQRDVAEEVHRENMQLKAEEYAVNAYNTAIIARRQADEATSKSTIASLIASEKDSAAKHARAYKEKMDRLAIVYAVLASLTLLHSCKHKYWEKSFALPSTHMHSFAQGMVMQRLWTEEEPDTEEALVEFTRRHMCRTFPSWQVIKAAPHFNYDPVPQWAAGCQFVSMNYHAVDEHLLLADGRFRENGSCGYVLKPQYLIDDKAKPDREQHWILEILSGLNLPGPEGRFGKKHVHPFVKVTLHDADSSKVIYTTQSSDRNAYNPVWHKDKPFDVKVKYPSVAVLLISVWDEIRDGSCDFIAASAVPVSCLRPGYRSVALFDSMFTRYGPYMFASLFVRVQRQDD